MLRGPEDVREEIEHHQRLLKQCKQGLRHIEQQLMIYAAGEAPVHLLNQRDAAEKQKNTLLQAIAELEQELEALTQGKPVPQEAPGQALSGDQTAHEELSVKADLLLDALPTGVLHLYSAQNLPLIKYTIKNPTPHAATVVVSSHIEQFSYQRSDTVRVEPYAVQVVQQLPILRLDEIAKLYEVRKAVLHTSATYLGSGQGSTLLRQDHDIRFLARDVIIWAIINGETVIDLSYQIAAWVTPNAHAVIQMLSFAAERHPSGRLRGYQGSDEPAKQVEIVRSQIQAIFLALQEHAQIRYIDAPISFGQKANQVRQRINLPKDSLAHRQANCIDGTVLYASLIERAGMNPVIVLVPGHTFVGWETWQGSERYEFLETTMTSRHTFDEALRRGSQRFKAARAVLGHPLFAPDGFAVMRDIGWLRKQDILPSE